MAAFSEVEMCWRGSGGSRKTRMVEVVAVSQLDTKPKRLLELHHAR